MPEQALGESNPYHLRHGYHADILRDSIFETLPLGWQDRLVPVPDCPAAQALDPHDLAAVKLLVARPKGLELVRHLLSHSLLDSEILRERWKTWKRRKPDLAKTIQDAAAAHNLALP